jgi:hypothetical protein
VFLLRCISDNDSDLLFRLLFYGRETVARTETLAVTSDAGLVHLDLSDNSVVHHVLIVPFFVNLCINQKYQEFCHPEKDRYMKTQRHIMWLITVNCEIHEVRFKTPSLKLNERPFCQFQNHIHAKN